MTVKDLFDETDTILHTKFTIGWVVNALNEYVPKGYLKCKYCFETIRSKSSQIIGQKVIRRIVFLLSE
jgi:sulfatase maturation enzyme AslB (radical SAM superfamily)